MGLSVPPAREMIEQIKAKVTDFKSDALTTDEAAHDIKEYIASRSSGDTGEAFE